MKNKESVRMEPRLSEQFWLAKLQTSVLSAEELRAYYLLWERVLSEAQARIEECFQVEARLAPEEAARERTAYKAKSAAVDEELRSLRQRAAQAAPEPDQVM